MFRKTNSTDWKIAIAKHLLEERTKRGLSISDLEHMTGFNPDGSLTGTYVTNFEIEHIERLDPDHPDYKLDRMDEDFCYYTPELEVLVILANTLEVSVLKLIWCEQFAQDMEKSNAKKYL